MKKRLSIALAAGLLVAGASVASATEMKQSFSKGAVSKPRICLLTAPQHLCRP